MPVGAKPDGCVLRIAGVLKAFTYKDTVGEMAERARWITDAIAGTDIPRPRSSGATQTPCT